MTKIKSSIVRSVTINAKKEETQKSADGPRKQPKENVMESTGKESGQAAADGNAAQAVLKAAGGKPETLKPTPCGELTIPKHRFDCVNLCLKETKQALREKTAEAEAGRIRIAELETALLDALVEKTLAERRAKCIKAAKALIDLSSLKPEQDGNVPGLEEQVLRIKESRDYLFESERETSYVLVPVKSGGGLNKSIAEYVKGTKTNGRTKK